MQCSQMDISYIYNFVCPMNMMRMFIIKVTGVGPKLQDLLYLS